MQYTKKVIEHFKNPHNQGEINNPDAIGEAGNMKCGDIMKIYLKLKPAKDKNKSIIQDIKFETLGCAAAIATSSVLTDLAKGKAIDQAIKIDKQDIVDELGGIPAPKFHCSILAEQALKNAIASYLSNEN